MGTVVDFPISSIRAERGGSRGSAFGEFSGEGSGRRKTSGIRSDGIATAAVLAAARTEFRSIGDVAAELMQGYEAARALARLALEDMGGER